jgi:hypothetical protein
MRRFIALGRTLSEAEEESPLIAMLLDDYYHRTLHGAPQSPDGNITPTEPTPESEEKKRPRKRKPRRPGSKEGQPAAQS